MSQSPNLPTSVGLESPTFTPILALLAGLYWTRCGHATKTDQEQSLSHSLILKTVKVRAKFSNRGDVTVRGVSSHVLPCEPWRRKVCLQRAENGGDTQRESCPESESNCPVAGTSQSSWTSLMDSYHVRLLYVHMCGHRS